VKFDIDQEALVALNRLAGESGIVLKPDSLLSCFASVDYYADPVDAVCSISRAIAFNHPFADGNKRTAALFLLSALCDLKPEAFYNEDLLVDLMVMAVTEHFTVQDFRRNLENCK
jgi:prophage maintenance system killer protein